VIPLHANSLLLVYFFGVGACIGSFLNVVIARLPNDESVVRPRSRCPTCKNPIAWYDNIPLLSFLLLRARCRHCGARIALRYFVVEFLMGALSAALWLRFGWSWEMLLWLPMFAALLAIAYLDIDEWWVPDRIVFPAMLWVGAGSFLPGGVSPIDALWGLGPALLAVSVAWVFQKLTGKEGLGFGDVKLLAVLGLATGLMGGLGILVLAALQATVIGVVVLLTGGHQSHKADGHREGQATENPNDDGEEEEEWIPPPRAIPFGPFLVLATFEVVLLPSLFGDLHLRFVQMIMESIG